MRPEESFWIMRPFNGLFFAVLAFFLLLLIVSSLLLKNKSEKTRQTVLIAASIVTVIGFLAYKYLLSQDAEFNALTADMGGFNWWGELPLNLCNINMILLPIAVYTKKRPLLSFCFFFGPLGALMALLMPTSGFSGYSFLLPRMLGFYLTHFMIFTEGIALACFGLYRPQVRDLPKTLLVLLIFGAIMFLFNMILRWTGLHPHANYFFTAETEGNALLEFFHRLIPVPFLFILPAAVPIAVYMLLLTLPFSLAERGKR